MEIHSNHPLREYNTFGVQVMARAFVIIKSATELEDLLPGHDKHALPMMVLGEGSNILFTQDFDGLIIKNAIDGIHVVKEDDEYTWVKAGAGVNWHHLVDSCIKAGFGGIENLSLIPGTVGAAPVQNIGAYGVELREVMEALEAYEITSGQKRYFRNSECKFGYRDSIFKNELKDRYIISNVILRLDKNPKLKLSYGNLKATLETMGISQPTLRDVSDAVIRIRKSKLPDPSIIGNAGSFFKNPIVSTAAFETLVKMYPQIPGYLQDSQHVKIPAAWLIEQCGWKGKRVGQAGVHTDQALVLVNYGNASGKEILGIARDIETAVQKKFNIALASEVNIM